MARTREKRTVTNMSKWAKLGTSMRGEHQGLTVAVAYVLYGFVLEASGVRSTSLLLVPLVLYGAWVFGPSIKGEWKRPIEPRKSRNKPPR